MDRIFQKLKEILPEVRTGVLMKEYTTFKIGGPAKYFFAAKTKEEIVLALDTAKKFKLPVFIFGGGSNLLVSDKGFGGLAIQIKNSKLEIQNPGKIYAGAGVPLAQLAGFAAENGFEGFEWAGGIPGATVGGAVFGHAQAFGEKISDWVESVKALNSKTFKFKNFSKKQCKFSLKSSIFKKKENLIIISAIFAPQEGNKEEIKQKLQKFLSYRKNNHPIIFPSAGSIFVNPERRGKVIRAGGLIEKAGLKGKKIGNAQISEQHANFIVNLGNARAKDVLALIRLVQKKVKQEFGISLETEVRLVGFR